MITPPPRGFKPSEFEARTAAAQAAMHAAGLDALLLCTEPEVRYFTGFLTPFWQSPTRPWFLVVPASGKPIAVIPEIGAVCMGRTWVDDIRTWPAPQPADEGLTLLVELLDGLPRQHGRVGVPKGHESTLRMPLTDYEALTARLPRMSFTDATPLVQGLRVIKSEAEIDKVRHACAASGAAFAALPSLVGEGTTMVEVFTEFRIAALRGGADDVPYLVGGAGPGGYGDIISPPTHRPLAHGDVLMLDTGCTFDGYFCDYDRNFAIGVIDEAARRAHEAIHDATEAGLAAAQPGTTCAELHAVMHRVLEDAGALGSDVGRYGHGLGMQLTEYPSNAPFDQTVLQAGMVLTLEPGMEYAPGKSLVHEENIVVRDGEAELLSVRAPREMPQLYGRPS